MTDEKLIAELSRTDISSDRRLSALKDVKKKIDSGEIKRDREGKAFVRGFERKERKQ